MMKQYISFVLRKLGLLVFSDYVKFLASYLIHYRSNKHFKNEFPDVVLPPDYILYESFGMLKYDSYYINGEKSAEGIIDLLKDHIQKQEIKVCEWGCGPARLARHLKKGFSNLGYSADCYGTDYNNKTIEWCRKNIDTVSFYDNKLDPPLPFENDTFDVLYCISVFTHLSEELQKKWFEECLRVIRPGGVFLFTVHGEMQSVNLLKSEKKIYDKHGIFVRGNVKEGQRNFAAYNSEKYMREFLLKEVEIVRYDKSDSIKNQDLWIVKKI